MHNLKKLETPQTGPTKWDGGNFTIFGEKKMDWVDFYVSDDQEKQ